MTLITRIIFLTMLLSFSLNNIVIGATDSYTESGDKKAVLAVRKAVGQIDKNKGAILIKSKPIDIIYKSIEIVGLKTAVSHKSIEIEETLKDLNAKKIGIEIQISLSGDVLFDFDKWDIKFEAEETLEKISRIVTELKKKNMLIEGHTDSRGENTYNLNLSRKRADSIKKWFLEKGGLNQVRLTTKGYGELKSIAPNTNPDGSDNPEGRTQNRRIEIRITQ
jgi:outer membrane protein OmpA-like peptidoglycan-associated protein